MDKNTFKIGQKLAFFVYGKRLEGTYLDDAYLYTKDKNSNVVNIKVTFDETEVSPIGSSTRISLDFIKN